MRDTATMVNAFDIDSVDALDPELRQIVRRRASLLGPAYKLFYANPVRIVRGALGETLPRRDPFVSPRFGQIATFMLLPPSSG